MAELGPLRKDEDGNAPDRNVMDSLLEAVGTRGRFQQRFNWTFNLLVMTFAAMPYVNFVIALTVPDHWCHVPGRESTNYTQQQWKALHIPRKEDNASFEKCLMFNSSSDEPIPCQQGWDYDRTWFSRTAPSQEDWVCEDELKVVNVFSFGQLGEVVGTLAFAHIGDMWGRRTAFFLSALTSSATHCLMVATAHSYPLFVAVSTLASATNAASFQAPLTFSMEVCDEETKGRVMMMQCLAWTLGMLVMPMVAWLCRDWVPFMLATSIPLGLAVFLHRLFPESPRWLASRGDHERCLESLREIARVNGTAVPPGALQQLRHSSVGREKSLGVASLFSSWRLILNTLLISTCRMVFELAYYSLLLNVTNLEGNPFMNFAWQSLAEFPGYVAGRWVADHMGRRWSQVGVSVIAAFALFIAAAFAAVPELSWICSGVTMFARLCLIVQSYVSYLQAMEAFPTCVRQTGTAVGNVAAGALVVVGPYIVYLGKTDPWLPFAVLGAVTLAGALLASFIPETLHVRQPETLQEAQVFGSDQPYFSCIGMKRRCHTSG
ncbi:solute carrier family 22 member 7-like [Schistocerca piceifrons]|uniref:solute carrier family 22 member 7-like n=1 Tax=Schistocerca piceifrons TaxID=274613 RepID=UPI001F5F86E6|nr:solute carrier family 22 member 7-like [Schistocerca piceifrons]